MLCFTFLNLQCRLSELLVLINFLPLHGDCMHIRSCIDIHLLHPLRSILKQLLQDWHFQMVLQYRGFLLPEVSATVLCLLVLLLDIEQVLSGFDNFVEIYGRSTIIVFICFNETTLAIRCEAKE